MLRADSGTTGTKDGGWSWWSGRHGRTTSSRTTTRKAGSPARKVPRVRTYDYAHRRAVVRESAGRVDEFDQNADGMTHAYNSTSGVKWRLSFDAKNRVEAITTP